MIAKLRGLLDSQGDDWAVIDVGGVGYMVFCSGRTLSRLPAAGLAVTLVVETHVREDHIHLYGFFDAAERAWFRLLLTVQGVGSKVALSVLSVLPPDQLSAAIAAQDKRELTRAAGVGPKLAQRIVLELKDKAAGLAVSDAFVPAAAAAPGFAPAGGAIEDAVSALVNLGYRRVEAFAAVSGAARLLGENARVPELIRSGLKELAPREGGR
ncbi:MAG: Holliday junction branch migration protein RuvA [Alphaproteobacteria bacterium]|nr:Holliday junction branch migration protein RuvA [Alphaproteobacteria bacterium]